MKEKINWELQDKASNINAQVIATTASLNDQWRNELITLNLPNEVLNKLWLETAFFGVFLLLKRFSSTLKEEDSKYVNNAVKDAFLSTVPVIFGNTEEESKDFKQYLLSEYDNTLELYKNYEGVDTRMLFSNLIRDIFNSVKGSKIKFIDNTLWTKIRLKIALILGAGNKEFADKHGNEVYLPADNLITFADRATNAFSVINDGDINN